MEKIMMKNTKKILVASMMLMSLAGTSLLADVAVSQKESNKVTLQVKPANNQSETVVFRMGTSSAIQPESAQKDVTYAEYNFSDKKANVIFKGTKTQTVSVINLNEKTEYCVDVYRDGKKVQTQKFSTLAHEPLESPKSIAFQGTNHEQMEAIWRKGNGEGTLLLITSDKKITKPEDGKEYTVGKFGDSKAKIGQSNTYVVYNSLQNNGERKFLITGLQEDTKYIVQAVEFNGKGETINYLIEDKKSNPRMISSRLKTPVAAVATEITKSGFTANWSKSEKAQFFELDLASDENFMNFVDDFEKVDVGNGTSIELSDLKSGTYYYRVRAIGKDNVSQLSNVIKVEIK